MVRAVAKWPKEEIDRMAAQWRPEYMCPFVDVERWRCSVYKARPTICKVYGLTPGLECSHAPEAATKMSHRKVQRMFDRDEKKRGEVVGVLGFSIGWDDIGRKIAAAEG